MFYAYKVFIDGADAFDDQSFVRIEMLAEILNRDFLSLLDQPLLFKQDVMEKLQVVDLTYRSYVKEGKLKPMQLGKTEYYFARDLAKDLLASKYKKKS